MRCQESVSNPKMNLQSIFGNCIITQTLNIALWKREEMMDGRTYRQSDYMMPPRNLSGRGYKNHTMYRRSFPSTLLIYIPTPPPLLLSCFFFGGGGVLFQNFVAGENKYSGLSIPENRFSGRPHAEKNILSRQNLPAPPPPRFRIKWSPPYTKMTTYTA